MWQSAYVEANGLRLHYTRTGGNKPPVVLAHGFSDDGLCWSPVAERLAATYDVVMVDARGHGCSEGPEEGYGSAEQAADLAAVITALGLLRPAILGHSMGAAMALVLAGTYPTVPGAILLEDPPAWWFTDPAAPPPNRTGRFGERIVNLKRKTREEMIADQHAQSPSWSVAELEPWADSKLRLSFYVLNRGNVTPIDWPTTVQHITCPTLLITADPALGAIVTTEGSAAFQQLLPQAQIAHIPGAGHSVRREQFEPYMTVIQAFLAAHAQ